MSAHAIRVQLPGGVAYAPAFDEAASKTGSRSGLPAKVAKALNQLVTQSVAILNSGNSTMITLEMTVHDDAISAKLTGKGCTKPTKKLVGAFEAAAAKKATEFTSKSTKTAHTIAFRV